MCSPTGERVRVEGRVGRKRAGQGGKHIHVNTLEWIAGKQNQDTQVGTCMPTLRLPKLPVGHRNNYNMRGKRYQGVYFWKALTHICRCQIEMIGGEAGGR